MAHRTIVGIDVGTTKVCTIVAQVQDNGRVNVLGVGLTASKGLDKGVVVNIDDAVNAIATSVEKAERLSGYRIGTAFVGVAFALGNSSSTFAPTASQRALGMLLSGNGVRMEPLPAGSARVVNGSNTGDRVPFALNVREKLPARSRFVGTVCVVVAGEPCFKPS